MAISLINYENSDILEHLRNKLGYDLSALFPLFQCIEAPFNLSNLRHVAGLLLSTLQILNRENLSSLECLPLKKWEILLNKIINTDNSFFQGNSIYQPQRQKNPSYSSIKDSGDIYVLFDLIKLTENDTANHSLSTFRACLLYTSFVHNRLVENDDQRLSKINLTNMAKELRQLHMYHSDELNWLKKLPDSMSLDDLSQQINQVLKKGELKKRQGILKKILIIAQTIISKKQLHAINKQAFKYRPSTFGKLKHPQKIQIELDKVEIPDEIDPEGLSPQDVTPYIDTINITPEREENNTVPLSLSEQKRRIYFSKQETIRDNQYLPDTWHSLNAFEINQLVESLKLTAISTEEKINKLLIYLCLATGTYPDEAENFIIYEDYSQIDFSIITEDTNILCLAPPLWVHSIPLVNKPYIPDTASKNLLINSGNIIALPLPQEIHNSLCNFPDIKHFSRFKDLFEKYNYQPIESIRAYCKKLRSNSPARTTPPLIANLLFQSVIRETSDPVAAGYIMGLSYNSLPIGMYYTASHSRKIQNIYNQTLSYIGLNPNHVKATPTPFDYIGSQLITKPEVFETFVANLTNQVQKVLQKNCNLAELIEAHNWFTTYCLQVLFYNTGHRIVNDPFESADNFLADDNAFIITDKVSHIGLEGRICWLSDRAVQQTKLYLKHLSALQSRFNKFAPEISLIHQIESILDPLQKQKIPLFFYISPESVEFQSITPGTLKKYIAPLLPLELNNSRHYLMSKLFELNCPEEFRSYQLGHIAIGQEPFSSVSVLSPKEVKNNILPFLNQIIENHWPLMKGISPSTKPYHPNQKIITKSYSFGALKREIKRKQKKDHPRQYMQQIAKEMCPELFLKPPQEPQKKDISAIEKRLLKNTYNKREVYINLFRCLIRSRAKKYHWTQYTRRQLFSCITPEKSPFDYNSGKKIKHAYYIKEAFQWFIIHQLKNHNITLEDQLINILCSALIFDRFLDKRYLNKLLIHNLMTKTNYSSGHLWVELDIPEHLKHIPAKRWFVHPITMVLLLNLHKRLKHTEIQTDKILDSFETFGKNKAHILKRLKYIKKTYHKQTGKKDYYSSLSWEKFIKALTLGSQLQLPGYSIAYLTGQTDSTSLTESAWTRLRHKRPITIDTTAQQKTRKKKTSVNINSLLLTGEPASVDFVATIDAVKTIKKTLNQVQSPIYNGSKELSDSKKRLQLLTDVLNILLKNNSGQYPAVLLLLMDYGLHMIRNGTRTKKTPALKTIKEYLSSILKPLVIEAIDSDIINMSELEFEELYEQVLNYTTDDNRPYMAELLKYFHDFLTNNYSVPELDFREIEPNINQKTGVDANIVTPCEFQKSLSLISDDKSPTHSLKNHVLLQLIILEGSGMRAAEPLRLTLDSIITQPEPQLFLKAGLFGPLKSTNAVRQISLNQIPQDSLQYLSQYLDNKKAQCPKISVSLLLSNTDNCRYLRDKSHFSKYLKTLLKISSGDQKLSMKNFRHSYATFSFFVINKTNDKDLWQIKDWLPENLSLEMSYQRMLNIDHISRRSLFYLAQKMGHGHPSTTLRNYIHSTDFITSQFIKNEFNESFSSLSLKEMAELVNISYVNARKLISRNCNGDKESIKTWEKMLILIQHSYLPEQLLSPKYDKNISNQSHQMPQLVTSTTNTHCDLRKISELIKISKIKNNPDGLENTFGISCEQYQQFIAQARKLEEQSRFTPFALKKHNNQWPGIKTVEEKQINNKVKDHSIIPLFNTLYKTNLFRKLNLLVQSQQNLPSWLIEIANLWLNCLKKNNNTLYFKDIETTKYFLDLSEKMGVKKSCYILQVNNNSIKNNNTQELISNSLNFLGLSQEQFQISKKNYILDNNAHHYNFPGIKINNTTDKFLSKSLFFSLYLINLYIAIYIKT